jgi:peptidoglycan hydrolase-like protein with peptidoglycan-binding domain
MSNQIYKFSLITILVLASSTFTSAAHATYTKCRNPDLSINKYCFKLGDRGVYIKNISIVLKEIEHYQYYQDEPTNIFNKSLEKSVVKFQQDYGLNSDGIVGNKTLLTMCQVRGKGCPPPITSGCLMGSPKLVTACLDKFKI